MHQQLLNAAIQMVFVKIMVHGLTKLDYVAQAYVIPRVPTTCKGMQKCRKHSCRVNRSATKSKFRCFGCLLRDVNFDDFGQKEQNAFRDTHLDDLGFPKMYEPELYGD